MDKPQEIAEGDFVWVRHRIARDVLRGELCLDGNSSMFVADIPEWDIWSEHDLIQTAASFSETQRDD